MNQKQIPKFAFSVHKSLSPKYEMWARQCILEQKAKELSIDDIAGTEWPLFGSVFYLLATESLQQAWESDNSITSSAPKHYAAGAIEAATELVVDPVHASWVKLHWGDEYLHHENVFYRMLVINSLRIYEKLLCGDKYMPLLRNQVETLSQELDKSPHGLLDDYPGQCYPTDIIAAIYAIKQADKVLGTDHSAFVKRSVRGFKGNLVDWTGLPPYEAVSTTGTIGKARGCSSQWAVVWTPYLWPVYSKQLYDNFEKHFWQENWLAAGFREFPKGSSEANWYADVDAGPVLAGLGAAASAFGIGAARANGHFEHAYPLTAEAIVLSWPLPNGTLAGPRILSNITHAPYLGEAALLFSLTREPGSDTEISMNGRIPTIVYLALALYLLFGIVAVLAGIFALKHWRKQLSRGTLPMERIQVAAWAILLMGGIILSFTYSFAIGLLVVLLAQLLPKGIYYQPTSKNRSIPPPLE